MKDSLRKKIERREARRLNIAFQLKYKVAGKDGPQKKAQCVDIAGKGIKLHAKQALKAGTKIEIDIDGSVLSCIKPLSFKILCSVVWCKEIKKGLFAAGVVFIKIKNSQAFMRLFCDKMIEVALGEE